MKNILFIVAHRKGRAPGQRFRFEQYLDYLQENGYNYTISNLLNENDDYYFYQKGHILRKMLILLKSIFIRIKDVLRAPKFDIVFIYREALFTRSNIFERLFCKRCKKVFIDFDDAIFLLDISEANKKMSCFKRPQKVNNTLQHVSMAIVGNDYLKNYASKYCSNIKVFPTTVNLNEVQIFDNQKQKDKICIGWIGSTTTIKHLQWAVPILEKIYVKYGNKVFFKIIADVSLNIKHLPIVNVKWNKDEESKELSSFDIGIMPLPDDMWTRGKCGFKGLQCMAYRIPVVMSSVGVNKQIIHDGKNGFLANTEEQWIEKLSLLIDNDNLRLQIGNNGRKTVEEHYSYNALKNTYLSFFQDDLLC